MNQTLNQTISDRLEQLMKALGYTPFTLNKAAGLGDAVRSILSGKSQHPRIDSLISIAETLGVGLQDLLEPADPARNKPIGERLQALRASLEASPESFAKSMGLNPSSYFLYEAGMVRLTADHAMKLTSEYGLTLDYLFLGRKDTLPAHISSKLEAALNRPT